MTEQLLGVLLASAVLALAPPSAPARAADLVDFQHETPVVRFDAPPAVVAREVTGAEGVATLATGERLVVVELPVSVLVREGDVGRVDQVVIEVDGAEAGLAVHDYAPATRLESDYTGQIEVQKTNNQERHREVSLGGKLSLGGAVSQLTPGGGVSRTENNSETKTLARRPPKQAIVVSGPVNRRRGVLFKFRPSSQTTLEGEHDLRITFVAPADWHGGDVEVRCHAAGERKILFVKQPAVWGRAVKRVSLRVPVEEWSASTVAQVRHTTAKPALSANPTTGQPEPTANGPIWKPRKTVPTPEDSVN